MQRKIGEIFEFGGEWYQCLKGISCKECDFSSNSITCDIHGAITCTRKGRSDDTSVVFKKLKKVGKPFELLIDTNKKVLMQEYKIYGDMYIWENKGVLHTDCFNGIRIEIKENKKEDMEIDKVVMNIDDRDYLLDKLEAILHDTHCQQYKDEICEAFSKYIVTENVSNSKPFNLEEAKAGKPVCTRDGRKARIICFDRVNAKPILALIASTDGKGEDVFDYFVSGKRIASALESDLDLMMPLEKKEGWVNISNCPDNGYSNYDSGVIVFKTKEEAINFTNNKDYIDTVKVTWEE